MPEFEVMTVNEAQARTALVGRRGRLLQEYVGYIQQLGQKQAGRLQATGDEKIMTVRRRLTQAAQVLNVNVVIKRSGEEVYFWLEPSEEKTKPPRNVRRRRSQPTPEDDASRESHRTEVG